MIHDLKNVIRLPIFATFLFALVSGIANATEHAISGSNFTMLSPPTGSLVGGATDVSGTFDDTKICDSTACTDIAMTLASDQPLGDCSPAF